MKVTLDGNTTTVEVLAREPELVVRVGEGTYVVEETLLDDGKAIITLNGTSYHVSRVLETNRVHLKLGNRSFSVAYQDAVTAAALDAASADEILAEMPGVVVDVLCATGDEVSRGDALLTIESMKMQIPVAALRDGIIDQIHVVANENFEKNALLVSLVAED